MLRKEQFAFGAALIASALAVILKQSLAWLILFIGLGLVFDFYIRDLIWGTNRLSREEIEKMRAEDYKALVLGNPKTESWVNWQLSGREAFKKQMRSLAREAVIFMLVMPLIFIAGFAYAHHESHAVLFDMSKATPIPVPEGYALDTPVPPNVRGLPPGATVDPGPHDAPIPDIQAPPGFVPVPPGAVLVPVQSSSATLDLLESALWFGLYGFPLDYPSGYYTGLSFSRSKARNFKLTHYQKSVS